MSRRVQLSLLFNDSDVYENMVIPWKQNKELNPLILKLLSAYYYSDEIRGMVDTFGEEDLVYENVTTSFTDMLSDARSTLAYMSMMAEGAQNALADGMDEINSIASATGGSPVEETEFGVSNPSFGRGQQTQSAGAVGVNADRGMAGATGTIGAGIDSQTSHVYAQVEGSGVRNPDLDVNNVMLHRVESLESQLSSMSQVLITLNNAVQNLISPTIVGGNANQTVTRVPDAISQGVQQTYSQPVQEPKAQSVQEQSIATSSVQESVPPISEPAKETVREPVRESAQFSSQSFDTTSGVGASQAEQIKQPMPDVSMFDNMSDIEIANKVVGGDIDIFNNVKDVSEDLADIERALEDFEPVSPSKPFVSEENIAPPPSPTPASQSEPADEETDGSESLAAFLNNGVGFSFEM